MVNDRRAEVSVTEGKLALCVQKQEEIRVQINQLHNDMGQWSVQEAFWRNNYGTQLAMLDGAVAGLPLSQEKVSMAQAQVDQAIAYLSSVQAQVAAANEEPNE